MRLNATKNEFQDQNWAAQQHGAPFKNHNKNDSKIFWRNAANNNQSVGVVLLWQAIIATRVVLVLWIALAKRLLSLEKQRFVHVVDKQQALQ